MNNSNGSKTVRTASIKHSNKTRINQLKLQITLTVPTYN